MPSIESAANSPETSRLQESPAKSNSQAWTSSPVHLYDSYGMGTRHLIVHGTAVDYHLLAEPTAMVPFLGNPGTTWAKVTVAGSYSHTAFSDHSINSIEEMWKLWRGLDEWVDKYKADNEFGGIMPQVNRAAIRGGDPWRAARTPAHCSMYIDIRFPPDRFPVEVQREFEAAVNEVAERDLEGPAHVEWYISRPGTVLSRDHPLVTSVSAAHRDVIGEGGDPVLGVCVCSDGMDANRFGIPTLQYGAGRAPDATGGREYNADPRGKRGESVRLDDISALAGVFTLATDTLMAGGLEGVRASRLPMPTGTVPTDFPTP